MKVWDDLLEKVLRYAESDVRVRIAALEGSRTNPNITPDRYQDLDVVFFVEDLESFKQDDGWLNVFGERLMMQKPEDMELFPPDLENGVFSYLMLFKDETKLDLNLVPLAETEAYIADSDGLFRILLDKDGRAGQLELPPSTDRAYWIKQPTARMVEDCCNEFWLTSTYAAKGLARHEFLYAVDHLHGIMRPNLLRMMAWRVGAEHGFTFSLGKNYKFLPRYLPADTWAALQSTYACGGEQEVWRSLFMCMTLFREAAAAVAEQLGCGLPDYAEGVASYIETLYRRTVREASR